MRDSWPCLPPTVCSFTPPQALVPSRYLSVGLESEVRCAINTKPYAAFHLVKARHNLRRVFHLSHYFAILVYLSMLVLVLHHWGFRQRTAIVVVCAPSLLRTQISFPSIERVFPPSIIITSVTIPVSLCLHSMCWWLH